MQAAELTLDAALRDASSTRPEARAKAVRNLAPALLEALGVPGPRWAAAAEHTRGEDVRRALASALADDDPAIRGLAAVGLATIGDAGVLARTDGWIDDATDDEAVAFLRQCAVIATSLVGAAAPHGAPEGERAREDARKRLQAALASPLPDVRFQAALGLVEVADTEAEAPLLSALETEEHEEVRENLVAALSRIDPPGVATRAAMRALLDAREDDPHGPVAIAAALLLAAARDPHGRPWLVDALVHRGHRDDALEALAVLGPAPPEHVEPVRRLAESMWTAGVTRVRAAYALSRMTRPAGGSPDGDGSDPGLALLSRLRFHPRGAVREAVRDALRLLQAP
jgi:HEAT repeat protein